MQEVRTHVSDRGQVTQLLLRWKGGEERALEELIPLIYAELRRLAHRYMRGERVGHTLQTSALINEAYLRLVESSQVNWRNRAHFLAVSAQQMRRVLVDFARSRGARKRGAAVEPVPLDSGVHIHDSSARILDVDEALSELARRCPRRAKVIELRFFGGLTAKETAEVLEVSEDTVLRDWRLARAELLRSIASHADESK